jgi:hypothetical protein
MKEDGEGRLSHETDHARARIAITSVKTRRSRAVTRSYRLLFLFPSAFRIFPQHSLTASALSENECERERERNRERSRDRERERRTFQDGDDESFWATWRIRREAQRAV